MFHKGGGGGGREELIKTFADVEHANNILTGIQQRLQQFCNPRYALKTLLTGSEQET